MATLRTEDEKLAILARCCALEKSGGDILAYLRSQHYVAKSDLDKLPEDIPRPEAGKVHGRKAEKKGQD